ncbi:hypothetical protein P3X46_001475 [Hevea brasiliensis]|uniref:ABC transporter domain-containing protein n=1 Tax=Hevea brasiliensis TaxID=3981 RepID=A0ABQ9NFE1_HEVBR|nr:hypothetical protein P3X46_001475 [Hevea brasiliensis]
MENVFASSIRSRKEDEEAQSWAAIERLPTYTRLRTSLFKSLAEDENQENKLVDVSKFDVDDRSLFLKKELSRVGIQLPIVEVRFERLRVEANCDVGTRALPTLLNTSRNILESVLGLMTLLLGPPSSGKTTLLLALAGKLDPTLKIEGQVSYNGFRLDEFEPRKTSAYVSQNDVHLGDLTVKETFDYSAWFQGVAHRYDQLNELDRREKEAGIIPDSDSDLFMKDTVVGDEMTRGISGGQKKRVTTGEMIVGPTKTLFMDEISTGLDSSATYQIVRCMQQIVHLTKATAVMFLLQPDPETFELFDDVVLLSEGQIVYQDPREQVVPFFESCGFKCPERKGTADFLQEVTSKKDQEQYWAGESKPYRYVTVTEFARQFKAFHVGLNLEKELSISYDKARSHKAALVFQKCRIPKLQLFKACIDKEKLLMRSTLPVYIFKAVQIFVIAVIAATVFLRTTLHVTYDDGSLYVGATIFVMIVNMFNGFAELSTATMRLPVFYKQRDLLFYPAWAFTLPNFLLRVPISVVESFVWTALLSTVSWILCFCLVRFFKQTLLIFLIQQMAAGLFRLMAGVCRTMIITHNGGALALLILFLLGGFILPRGRIPVWWTWAYWISPVSYGIKSLTVNELLSPRWINKLASDNVNKLSTAVLENFGVEQEKYWCWIGAVALLGFTILFNVLFTFSLMYLNSLGKPQAIIPEEVANEQSDREGSEGRRLETKISINGNNAGEIQMPQVSLQSSANGRNTEATNRAAPWRGMILPFTPLAMSFDSVNYYVDMPSVFLDEVMELVELTNLKNAIVGLPGITGLSTEQRKRLTIAVELVVNPSIIFMDEPTSGLNARAAAIVMRTVRNTVDTGRTVVCTIHQPSIDIFEAFDELVLMKRGGKLIYSGPLGQNSRKIIKYFEAIPGVPRIKERQNPAAWMLEASSAATQVRLGIDFAEHYKSSSLYKQTKAVVKDLSTPSEGATDIYFPTQYPQSTWGQQQSWTYWRSPYYNLLGYFYTLVTGLVLGTVFWQVGAKREDATDLTMIIGAMYVAVLFVGINNCSTVQPIVAVERTVFYRERAAGMYSALPNALAQVMVEIPCIFVQTVYYSLIVYSTVTFQWKLAKFFWFFFITFFSFLYFTYYGMMTVSITPNDQVAAIFASAFYALFTLFSCFFIPKPRIPKWRTWHYYICPVAWTVYGLKVSGIEPDPSIKWYVQNHYGYDLNFMGPTAAILVAFGVLFALMFTFCIKKLSFQNR